MYTSLQLFCIGYIGPSINAVSANGATRSACFTPTSHFNSLSLPNLSAENLQLW